MSVYFKNWLMEMANYGLSSYEYSTKIQGGTEELLAPDHYTPIKYNEIIDELCYCPEINKSKANKKYEHIVEWGNGFGALQVTITPLGSSRAVTRQQIYDLEGNKEWITRSIQEISDNRIHGNESTLASNIYDKLKIISENLVPVANGNFDRLETLARKVWSRLKENHPSYCMFPTELKIMNDHHYKMIFEFKGQGSAKETPVGSKAEQYNIDLFYNNDTGLIKSVGYDITSAFGVRTWEIENSDFIEYFSPNQPFNEIIECIKTTFMQY